MLSRSGGGPQRGSAWRKPFILFAACSCDPHGGRGDGFQRDRITRTHLQVNRNRIESLWPFNPISCKKIEGFYKPLPVVCQFLPILADSFSADPNAR